MDDDLSPCIFFTISLVIPIAPLHSDMVISEGNCKKL